MVLMFKNLLMGAVIALFLSAYPAFASDFSLSFPGLDQIFAGDMGVYDLVIENNGDGAWFTVSVFPSQWISQEAANVFIDGSKSAAIKFYFSPPEDAKAFSYRYVVKVENVGTKEIEEKTFLLDVLQKRTAAVLKGSQISCIECDGEAILEMDVENIGTANIRDVVLFLTIGEQKVEVGQSDLPRGERYVFSASAFVNDYKPGEYPVKGELYGNRLLLGTVDKTITVPVKKDIKVEKLVTPSLFGAEVVLRATNTGNAPDNAAINDVPTGGWWASYSGPEPDQKGADWTWFATLQPGQSTELKYTQFYWPVPLAGVGALALAGLGYLQMTALVVRKGVRRKQGDDYSVTLHILNRGGPVEGTVVRDVVPHGFLSLQGFETAKPVVRKIGEGTELLWRIGTLRRGEERVLHYTIRASRKESLASAVVRGNRGSSSIVRRSNGIDMPYPQSPESLKLKVDVEE